METRALGIAGEDIAVRFLARAGWRIVARNVRYREGELDVIAARGSVLAFVEVKTRRSRAYGIPAEAVTPRKRARIRAMAVRYLAEHRPRADGIRFDTVRFDVVEVARSGDAFAVTHLEAAF
jgi:putative endonuclease